VDTPGLVEHIAEIEVRQRIARIGFDGRAIVLFGQSVFLAIVVKRSQIDMSRGVGRIAFQNFQVGRDSFRVRVRVLFERNAAGEQLRNVGLFRVGA
jgi:hypothetical protein